MNKITLVLVIYNEAISDLPAIALLNELVAKENFQIILYDNSPLPQENPITGAHIIYFHDATNPGLAKAYNFAWKKAKEFCSTGLLLLDDDTTVTMDYLQILENLELDASIGAYLPQIFSGEKLISPVYADHYINRDSQFPQPGVTQRHVMAINSGSFIPLNVLNEFSGFNEEFSLDFLDHWLFWRLHQSQYKIKIIPMKLQHQLSVLDYSNVSLQRYTNILLAEKKYYTTYQTEFAAAHKKQLYKRLFKQFLTVKNRKIWRQTFAAIKNY